MKIAVVGCGAMGSVYAARLASAGNEVLVVDHTDSTGSDDDNQALSEHRARLFLSSRKAMSRDRALRRRHRRGHRRV